MVKKTISYDLNKFSEMFEYVCFVYQLIVA